MKICVLKLEEISDGKYGNWQFHVSESYVSDLEVALEMEHDCNSNSCDICSAMKYGFPHVAAFLLSGATETELLDAVTWAHEFNGTRKTTPEPFNSHDVLPFHGPEGWTAWGKIFDQNATKCENCGSYVFTDETSQCGNCLHDVCTG